MTEKCLAIAKSGSRCSRPALAGNQHCLMHDPASAELRREASRKGGRARSNQARAAKQLPPAFTTEEVQALQLRRSGCDYRTIAARCAARSAAGCAAAREGFDFLGCDTDADYVEIARRRIAHWQGPLFASATEE